MTLPNKTLFPGMLLPLYIFEPRHRKILTAALHSDRMFAVAMQKPGSKRSTPSPVAGLGVIRVAVRHKDDTSHLILQGIARVKLEQAVRYKPYRVQQIHPIETPPCDSVAVDALLAKVRELLGECVGLGLPLPPFAKFSSNPDESEPTPAFSPKEILGYLDSSTSPEQTADLVSFAVLPGGVERQAIMETIDVESRLRRLIQFLLAEINKKRKGWT